MSETESERHVQRVARFYGRSRKEEGESRRLPKGAGDAIVWG